MSLISHINAPIFNEKHRKIISTALDCGQGALFTDWHPPGQKNSAKKQLLDTLISINDSYPNGLKGYVDNSRNLLKLSKEGKNPYQGFIPHNPDTVDLFHFDDKYLEMEKKGLEQVHELAVVLVAGGLGERLGYNGIKIDIPFELTTCTSYIAYYASYLRTLEKRIFSTKSSKKKQIPLVVMVSPYTEVLTKNSFEANNYYGLKRQQVVFIKQELVPSLKNNKAELAKKTPYELVLKPHGHGDVHLLMYKTRVAQKLWNGGIRYLLFIQDTNAQVVNVILPALGVSVTNKFVFNSIGVPRVMGESVGAITKLVSARKEMTINVEYNQLDALLLDSHLTGERGLGKGMCSSFPGNTNALIICLKNYLDVLEKSKGVIAEFINPKYQDKTKTSFKSPTRLETMMQDLPKFFSKKEKVGVTVFNRTWAFSANKNNHQEAAQKSAEGDPVESVVSAESDFYEAGRMRLKIANNVLEALPPLFFRDFPFKNEPRVFLKPSFALTLDEVRKKIIYCRFGAESTLVIGGENVILDHVILKDSSALIVNTVDNAFVEIKNLEIQNPGLIIERLSEDVCLDPKTPQYIAMRGYRIIDKGAWIFDVQEPGYYVINKKGELIRT